MNIVKLKSDHIVAKLFTSKNKISSRRAVSPIIATLLLIAIAGVGGSGVFAFSEEYFGSSQISGSPQIEFVKILGYDARDVKQLKAHDGQNILSTKCCGINDGVKNPDERIAIYIQSNSVQPIIISELRLGGTEYQYTSTKLLGNWKGSVGPQQGEYVIMAGHDGTPNGDILQANYPKIQSGEIITLVLDLDRTINDGRDMQIKLTTTNGNVVVSTIRVGQIFLWAFSEDIHKLVAKYNVELSILYSNKYILQIEFCFSF